ncbi:tetratricopeptide repeat protein [Sulfitobacter sp. SH24]|uniref:tetratricopeptide repeat protein n=1 Tax=Sulfitobacter sp. SH24 TaxID=3421173 RepID=UPI003F4FA8ED
MSNSFKHIRRIFLITAMLGLTACAVPTEQENSPERAPQAESDTLRLAQATAKSGDHANAARLFEKVLSTDADSVAALKGAGDAYSRMGQQSRAETVLVRAHELDPNNDEVLALLGRVFLAQDRSKEAVKYYDKALRANRSNISAITGKGVALDTMSQHLKAQKVYQEGLSTYPTNFVLRSNYALSVALSGNFNKAISILQELVRDPNAAPHVRDNLALVYGLAGQETEARATLSLDMSAEEIEENITVYRALRRMMQESQPIGSLVFA